MKRRREDTEIRNNSGRLQRADLSGAGLEGACLYRANLAEAILNDADLRGSDLQGANLRKASLYEADLKGANLDGSNLGMSDLRWTCLEQANLRRVNLNQANLLGARMAGAILDCADLEGSILPDGTLFAEESNLERFTDRENPAFKSTLAAVEALERGEIAEHKHGNASIGYRHLPWKQFVEQNYGILADDPIEWNESPTEQTGDALE